MAIITSVYDSFDGNQDGKVSVVERIVGFLSPLKLEGMAVAEVAYAAANDLDVLERDPSFRHDGMRIWMNFTHDLMVDGAYTAWLSIHIQRASRAIAFATNFHPVKQFVIRKGMEQTVKRLYNELKSD